MYVRLVVDAFVHLLIFLNYSSSFLNGQRLRRCSQSWTTLSRSIALSVNNKSDSERRFVYIKFSSFILFSILTVLNLFFCFKTGTKKKKESLSSVNNNNNNNIYILFRGGLRSGARLHKSEKHVPKESAV